MDNIHDDMQQRNKLRVHWGQLGLASKLEMEAFLALMYLLHFSRSSLDRETTLDHRYILSMLYAWTGPH